MIGIVMKMPVKKKVYYTPVVELFYLPLEKQTTTKK